MEAGRALLLNAGGCSLTEVERNPILILPLLALQYPAHQCRTPKHGSARHPSRMTGYVPQRGVG